METLNGITAEKNARYAGRTERVLVDGPSREDSNTYSTLSGDVTNIIKTYKSSFILGEMDIDTNWQKFQSDMETAGLAQMLTIVTEAYKTFMANQ